MKKLFLFLVVVCAAIAVSAQEEGGKDKEKVLEKPKDINIQEFDDFKNSSFNIYEKSLHYKKMSEGEEGLKVEDVTEAKKLKEDVVTLNKKADEVLEKAKNVKPKTKSPAAVKNTQKSVEALKEATKNLDTVLGKTGKE